MNENQERRRELRRNAETTVFIEYYANGKENEEAQIILCSSLDISRNGVQIQLDTELPKGTILRIGIDSEELEKPLFLVGEVKWTRVEGDVVNTGFELFDAEETDISRWQHLFEALQHDDQGPSLES